MPNVLTYADLRRDYLNGDISLYELITGMTRELATWLSVPEHVRVPMRRFMDRPEGTCLGALMRDVEDAVIYDTTVTVLH